MRVIPDLHKNPLTGKTRKRMQKNDMRKKVFSFLYFLQVKIDKHAATIPENPKSNTLEVVIKYAAGLEI